MPHALLAGEGTDEKDQRADRRQDCRHEVDRPWKRTRRRGEDFLARRNPDVVQAHGCPPGRPGAAPGVPVDVVSRAPGAAESGRLWKCGDGRVGPVSVGPGTLSPVSPGVPTGPVGTVR